MSLDRRRFLALLGGGGAAAAAGVLPGCAPDNGPAPSVTVPAPGPDGNVRFLISDYPELGVVGGAVIARAPGLDPLLVVRASAGGLAALAATCTHLGCPLGYEAPDVVCPCHQSRFALDGRVLRPPARAPLETVEARLDVTGEVTLVLATFPPLVNGLVRLEFADFPQLATPGGSAVGRPAGYPNNLIVLALPAGGHGALEARCPHAGCTVGWPGTGDVLCPCHGSRFTTGGALVQGPATVGLPAFSAVADATGVTVTVA